MFSVLIANYNNAAYLNDAFNSLLAQTYTNWEAIVVDDSSTDNSAAVLKLWEKDKRFRIYFNDRNYGCGYTKKKCAEYATGKICGYLDPDDLLLPKALETMLEAHKIHATASLVYSDFITADKNLQHQQLALNKSLPLNISYLQYAQAAIGHFSTFKKNMYDKTDGLNPELIRAVDQDLFYKMEEVGDLIHINTPLYIYRLHKGGISVFENFNRAFAWHTYVVIDACKRRNIPFEDIVAKLAKFYYIDYYERSKAYKLGKLLTTPYKFIQKIFSNKISIRTKN